jgi:uncharacterized protein
MGAAGGSKGNAERDTRDVPAERDLTTLLATLDVARRPGTFAYVQRPPGAAAPRGARAMIDEETSTTYIVDVDSAPEALFRAAWLTLTVHSALEAVGLTAAVAGALATAGIPANVLAGHDHDHLLVPEERADDAIAAIRAISAGSPAAAP